MKYTSPMNSRVVRVYDGPGPTVEEMMFGDPAKRTSFPNEAWSQEMQAHEVALFCVNFKSETPVREETGRPGPHWEETCRIFSNVEDAAAYAQNIVRAHPSTVCLVRSKDEKQLRRISNGRFMRKFAFVSLIGTAVWVALAAGIGLAIILLVRGLVRGPGFQWVLALSAWQWMALAAVAVVLGFSALLLKMFVRVSRKTVKFHQAINATLSPEERTRYREADILAVSSDPEDREKARQLTREYSDRIGQIRRDMK